MKKCIIVIIAVFYSFLCANMIFAAANTWTQKAPFEGTARESAVGFSIGSKGYIGTGWDGSSLKKDFWEYDPAADTWTEKAPFEGTARESAVGFSIGSKGYIGTGWDGSHEKDFWEYDPVANTWTKKADFGGTARDEAVGFSIGSKGYIGPGFDGSSFKKDFWEYDPTANTWTKKADFGGTTRDEAVGFSIGSRGYIGAGYGSDFWEYNPFADTWTQRAFFEETARYGAIGFSIGSKGYIGTGWDGSSYKKDFWEYDASDIIPDQFTFIDQGNVAVNTVITSNTITVSGITLATPISITGGTYSINSGGYVGADGTVNNGDTVTVQQTSSGSASTTTDATLTIGGVSDTFSVTTAPCDATPVQFTFTDQTGVGLSQMITSNTITVSGITCASAISITGGTYSINGGYYTSASLSVNNGDTVTVQQTSSGINSTTTDVTLTIGGVSDTFSVTTLPCDTIPAPFTFTDQTGVGLSQTITSNTITVSGITCASAISITGGTYSINSGGYTGADGTVNNGDTVTVQQTSSGSYSTTTNATLTIGGVSDTFSVTTLPCDVTPDPFTFTDQTNVGLSQTITSNTITVSGIICASAISITGGTYSINSGGYTGADGMVNNGDTVTVRQTSSGSSSTTTDATLTIGGVSDTFSVTTCDTIPAPFTFTDQTNVGLSQTITSNPITVSGITCASAISITGGTYSIDGGAYTSVSGTVTNGQTVTVRQTSSGSSSTTTDATLTIGGVSDTFSVTTTTEPMIQVTPDALNFGMVPIGTGKERHLTVKNIGIGTLTGDATTVAPFSIVSGGSYSLGADQSQVVTIRYQPTSSGRHTGVVVFTGGVGATIPVTGTTAASLPWLMLLIGD
jgi:hypothetical protein